MLPRLVPNAPALSKHAGLRGNAFESGAIGQESEVVVQRHECYSESN